MPPLQEVKAIAPDSAADFLAEGIVGKTALINPANRKLAKDIHKALRERNAKKARDLLIAAEANQSLAGTFAAEAEAAIAAGFFYDGEREQSKALARAAAGANQPLGLWIQGLIAWEQGDMALASISFSRLAEHPALNDGSRAAAHFWAYRALSKKGNAKAAQNQLGQAGAHSHSFYGLLAAQLLGRERQIDPRHYPVPPWQPAQGFQVDRALLYAIAWHESRLDPAAVSRRGALGLMQIMPRTGAGRINQEELLDPAKNLAFGQEYMQQLASRPQIGNNLLLLLAAYNSGPNKLKRWIGGGAKSQRDPLLFIEKIPQRETRNYITRVMSNYWAYRTRLDQPVQSLEQLAKGQWPRLTLTDQTASVDGVLLAKAERP